MSAKNELCRDGARHAPVHDPAFEEELERRWPQKAAHQDVARTLMYDGHWPTCRHDDIPGIEYDEVLDFVATFEG